MVTMQKYCEEVDFPEGSIVEAIVEFETDNQNDKHLVSKGDQLKILKKDKMGDYVVNRINKQPWNENSWVSGKEICLKMKLVIIIIF